MTPDDSLLAMFEGVIYLAWKYWNEFSKAIPENYECISANSMIMKVELKRIQVDDLIHIGKEANNIEN